MDHREPMTAQDVADELSACLDSAISGGIRTVRHDRAIYIALLYITRVLGGLKQS